MKFQISSVLFLGVGGVSMHQLALAFKSLGVKVFGYDAHENLYTKECEMAGVFVTNKFLKDFTHVDLCVKTGAICEDNKYIQFLKAKGVKIVDRAEVLSWLCTKFKTVIAVSGTHGKSTTSALIYEMLKAKYKNVSSHIGADLKNERFNLGDDFLIVEACEYNKSFLQLYPDVSVVTNVEAEHMDSYGSIFNLQMSFAKFLKRANTRFVFKEQSTKFLNKHKWINFVEKTTMNIAPKLKGDHNLKNISLAIAVAKHFGVTDEIILGVVNNFKGVARRYEFLGNYKNSKVYIDYAHHPTEVKAFLDTFCLEYMDNQIVFQPHTFSRTKMFLKEFVSIFSQLKNPIIFKEYSAREKRLEGLSSKDLFHEIKKVNPSVKYCASYKSILKRIKNTSAIAFVGAGNINLVAEKIVKNR